MVLAIVAWASLWPRAPIDTDLLDLLPPTERNPVAEHAAEHLGRLTGDRAVMMVGAATLDEAIQAAGDLASALGRSTACRSVVAQVPSPNPAEFIALYQSHLTVLGRPPSPAEFPARILRRLSGPFGSGALGVREDPFSLFDSWLASVPIRKLQIAVEQGWLVARQQGLVWVLVSGELAGSAFDQTIQDGLSVPLEAVELAWRDSRRNITLLRAGAVFHAQAARLQAQREIHVIGLGSTAGVVVLLGLAFRSIWPLALGLTSVAIGLVAGLVGTVLAFGHIHVMTLVFGASLIGEAIDYAIQYFAGRIGAGDGWHPDGGLRAVLPGLTVALATSIVGYAALAWAPFPALRQIAVFAMGGLAAAWLTAVLLIPVCAQRPVPQPSHARAKHPYQLLRAWRQHIGPRRYLGGVLLLLGLSVPGWLMLTSDDDVRKLIQPNRALVMQEQRLRSIAGIEAGTQFLLVEGASEEDLLQREESLFAALGSSAGAWTGVSSFVPSCRRQMQNHAMLLATRDAQLAALDEAGFTDGAKRDWASRLDAAPPCLSLREWLGSMVSRPYRYLWLGPTEFGYAAVVLPQAGVDVTHLPTAAIGIRGVTLVDKPAAISRLFADYRKLAGVLVAAATLLIVGVLSLRYRMAGAVAMIVPTLAAQGVTLGVLGYAGTSLNLFNVLALLLVLGVGINYAIFLVEGLRSDAVRQAAALLGVVLSAATTLLSFGLLSLSSMPALSGFGATLALGIGISVLLAPGVLSLGRFDAGPMQ